jgi:hypothetical protein
MSRISPPHRATDNIEALALELPPDLAHAIDPEVLIEEPRASSAKFGRWPDQSPLPFPDDR